MIILCKVGDFQVNQPINFGGVRHLLKGDLFSQCFCKPSKTLLFVVNLHLFWGETLSFVEVSGRRFVLRVHKIHEVRIVFWGFRSLYPNVSLDAHTWMIKGGWINEQTVNWCKLKPSCNHMLLMEEILHQPIGTYSVYPTLYAASVFLSCLLCRISEASSFGDGGQCPSWKVRRFWMYWRWTHAWTWTLKRVPIKP